MTFNKTVLQIALRSLQLFGLAAIFSAGSAGLCTETFSISNHTINFDDSASLLTADEQARLKLLLGNLPDQAVARINYIKIQSTDLKYSYSVPSNDGGIIMSIAAPAIRQQAPFPNSFLIASPLGSLVKPSFGLPEQFEWNRLENHNYPNWIFSTEESFKRELDYEQRSWVNAGLQSWLYVASLFVDESEHRIRLYGDDGAQLTCAPIYKTENTVSFGPYTVYLDGDKVIGFQFGDLDRVDLKEPFELSSTIKRRLIGSAVTAPTQTQGRRHVPTLGRDKAFKTSNSPRTFVPLTSQQGRARMQFIRENSTAPDKLLSTPSLSHDVIEQTPARR